MDTPLNLQDAILNLQRYLRTISFVDSRITRVPIDGLFDSDTQKAVSEYQRTRGLAETGIVDKNTWDRIFDEYKMITDAKDRTPTVNFFPTYPENYEAVPGEKSTFISLIQLLLRELSVIYDSLSDVVENGIFDEKTENAVKSFQRANLLTPNGIVDTATWNALLKSYSEIGDNYL